MIDDLLDHARRKTERADASVRAAALLRIARVESGNDVSQARKTLLEGLELVQALPSSMRPQFLDEARDVAAAVAPEMLADLPSPSLGPHERFRSVGIVQIMLTHGHLDAAFNYLLHYDDSASFPFRIVGNMLHELDPGNPETAARRMSLLRHAVSVWRQGPAGAPAPHSGDFVRFFGHFWREFPPDEARALARAIVDRGVAEPDVGTNTRIDDVYFRSSRQSTLFLILHVLRRLDPALAQSLIDSNGELAAAARRYPNGLETMSEEVEAKAERSRGELSSRQGARCEGGGGGGYILTGKAGDFDRQRRIIDATRRGDFEPAMEGALEKYREDTSPGTPNYAPKAYWPSTGAFRALFYEAGRRRGREAAELLERIPDDDLRLFATIELAAALAGVPASFDHQREESAAAWRRACRRQDHRRKLQHRASRPGHAKARRRPDLLSKVRLPAFRRCPLELQMRSYLEYVLDGRELSCVSLPVGSDCVPALSRNVGPSRLVCE